jgi:hypothetical protein
MERVPIEIWEKILSYATTSSLIPFTESGELASSLVDTLDIFSHKCRAARMYLDDTYVVVTRLRLVCRTWASLLQNEIHRIAFTDLHRYYSHSKRLIGKATSLWVSWTACDCQNEETERSGYAHGQIDLPNSEIELEFSHDLILQMFSSHLKILSWHPLETRNLPMSALGNLRALSISTYSMSERFSLMNLSSFAPLLSHLRLGINEKNPFPLAEAVECASITSFSLIIGVYPTEEPKYLHTWTFPRLHTFLIAGQFPLTYRPNVEGFLSRHGGTITDFDFYDFQYGPDVILRCPFEPSLWKICPNISVLGMGHYTMSYIMETPEILLPIERLQTSPITVVVRSFNYTWKVHLASVFRTYQGSRLMP